MRWPPLWVMVLGNVLSIAAFVFFAKGICFLGGAR